MGRLPCLSEDTVAAFVEGRLETRAMSEVEVHAASCADCQRLLAVALRSATLLGAPPPPEGAKLDATESPERATPVRGSVIGRYTVLELAGRGGMGEVYAAFDQELDRKVAIKVLRTTVSDSGDARALLLREAQATAKLQHPNVVVVHDVGTYGDRVFIAMEFIDGQTLRAWSQSEKPSWREALRVFGQAGRGLAAAHAAGLVHRDFKPDNVMLTRDGQVRVMDFGLARAVTSEAPTAAGTGSGGDGDPDLRSTKAEDAPAAIPYLDVNLTRPGMRVGTPAYMALEQLSPGMTIDARADQFAFCVALYEALYGERPYGTDDAHRLQVLVATAKIRSPPPQARVPPWIRKILLRGLRPKREERFPTMTALLEALADDPAVRRRKRLTAVAVAGLVAVAALGARHLGGGDAHQMCGSGAIRLTGIWETRGASSARKEQIHAAFTASKTAFAAAAFDSVTRLLDQYVARWVAGYVDACEATHVRGEQSAEVLDLRVGCLNDRLGNLRALTDVLASADGKVVENAVSAAGALPALELCADVAVLRSVVKPPTDPKKRRRVERVREDLARFIALSDSGQCQRAAANAQTLIAEADATEYDPLRAAVLLATGWQEGCGDSEVAIDRLKAAYGAAIAGRDDRVATEAAAILPVPLGRLGQWPGARDWLGIGRAAVKRAGSGGVGEAWLLLAEADVRFNEGDFASAVEVTRRSLALRKQIFGGEHPETLIALMTLGNVLRSARRLQEALDVDREALELGARLFGREHPRYAMLENNAGEVLIGLGRPQEAQSSFGAAIQIFRHSGADSLYLAYPLTGLGRALLDDGHPADAVAPLEEALAIRAEKHPPARGVGETQFALARALWSRPAARRRAVILATAARTDLAEDPRSVAEVDAWLASSLAGRVAPR